MELCSLLPQPAGWHYTELGLKTVRRQRVKRQHHPTQQRQEWRDTWRESGLTPCPPGPAPAPAPINLSGAHCFVIFKEPKDFNNLKSPTMLQLYSLYYGHKALSWVHTTVELHSFFSPYKEAAFKVIARLHTWIAYRLSWIPLHIPTYFLSKSVL